MTSSTPNPKQRMGFDLVDPETKSHRIRSLFETVAVDYDFMNDLMSGGAHRLWKKHFIAQIRPLPTQVFLDVAGGTGDIGIALKRQGGGTVWVCDPAEKMVAIGRDKARRQGVETLKWVIASAEDLPIPSRSIDVYTIAFGIRNVTDIDQTLRQAYRVLKRGGRFFCLEFSQPKNPLLRHLSRSYELQILPLLGYLGSGHQDPYRYLGESIWTFLDPESLEQKIRQAGFSQTKWQSLSGGIVAIHRGRCL